MRAYLVGIVFLTLLVLGVWTVWLHAEALRLGYRMEVLRRSLEEIARENRFLRIEVAARKTPVGVLAREGIEPGAKPDTLMPPWNLLYVDPVPPAGGMRLASGVAGGADAFEGGRDP